MHMNLIRLGPSGLGVGGAEGVGVSQVWGGSGPGQDPYKQGILVLRDSPFPKKTKEHQKYPKKSERTLRKIE